MDKQFIVSIGRESGSGGLIIGRELATKLGVHLYDKNIIPEIANMSGYDEEIIRKHEEKPVNTFLSSRIRGHSNSVEENIALKQFEFLRSQADKGESFVVVGRCSDYVLREISGLITLFILGDTHEKAVNTADVYGITKEEAYILNVKIDKRRKSYHNHHAETKWGDSHAYDLTINSTRLGVHGTSEILYDYIVRRNESEY